MLGDLPRRQTRVLTWPIVSIFGFIARPFVHLFLKPRVTRGSAFELGFDFRYQAEPAWDTYASLLEFGREIKREIRDLGPRDMIDVLGFIRVLGSE